jgi:hypothetical protein
MAAKKKTRAKVDASSVQIRAYLAAQPPRTRVTLKKMRETILAALRARLRPSAIAFLP